MDGVGQAAAIGGISGGLIEGAGSLLKGGASEVGEAAESELSETGSACGLSFRADTPVETPTSEQAIGTLHVGDHVQAYNSSTKTVTTQTVQQVFINHDTDLIDVTLAVQPVKTQSKPQQVAVVSLKIIAGSASMYDLTVSNVHTFAVGDGQFVVHNCDSTVGDGPSDPVEILGNNSQGRENVRLYRAVGEERDDFPMFTL